MRQVESIDLLPHLEALLATESVTLAAQRMGLSPPAMSRALGRLRTQLGDPLLVRAGRRMVLTPRAHSLRDTLPGPLGALRRLLARPDGGRPRMSRPFRIRSSDAVPCLLGPPLAQALATRVDGAALVFVSEGDEGPGALRDGTVDLDLGVQGELGPEILVRRLLTVPMRAIAARGHPILAAPTLDAYCDVPHVAVSRTGRARGPLDEALAALGRARQVPIVVASFLDAALLVAGGGYLGLFPGGLAAALGPRLGFEAFAPPVALPPIPFGMSWHPRMQEDPAHRILRDTLAELLGGARVPG